MRELAIQRERLELDKKRFDFDVEHLRSTEKSKERTTKWQMVLPFLFSLVVIVINALIESYRSAQAGNLQKMQYELQYNQAVSSYNAGRIELFRKMTQGATSADEIMKVYKEVFPRDSIILQNEQKDVARR